jgi:uncharacterized glyoxalase superfamily protein PhnB
VGPLIDAVGIVSSDIARSLEFYRLLGLETPEPSEDGHTEITLPNGFRLMFDTLDVIHSFRPDWNLEAGNQLSLAFRFESPAEVDRAYATVTESGFDGEKEPWDAFWGHRYAQLRDPDRVPVDLFAPLE